MTTAHTNQLTMMLKAWGGGDAEAGLAVIPLIYPELQRRAQIVLRRASHQGQTIQTQALVHEAFLKLSDKGFRVRDRLHFYAISSTILRNILVDYVRELCAQKRGGGFTHMTLEQAVNVSIIDDAEQLLEIDHLLKKLRKAYPRKAKLCEMYYFSGLTIAELAELENLSVATVNNDLRFARAWMRSLALVDD